MEVAERKAAEKAEAEAVAAEAAEVMEAAAKVGGWRRPRPRRRWRPRGKVEKSGAHGETAKLAALPQEPRLQDARL